MTTILRSATLADGRVADVHIGDGVIAAIEASGVTERSDEEHDLGGHVLIPSAVEPHAHLDKALTADVVANPEGDLLGAIRAWQANYPNLTPEDVAARATVAARRSLASGITAIRTHVDINEAVGLSSVEALIGVKEVLAPLVDIQIVGLVGIPTAGPDGAPTRALLRQALDLGLDVVGGCPHIHEDSRPVVDVCLDIAGEFGRPIDLHMDENLDPASEDLEYFAQRIVATGFEHGATASHCVSLGVQPVEQQQRVAEATALAGIFVVTLPQTNLFLQAREVAVAPPRGLTALAALDSAGVTVAAGADNLQDPFNTMGRADPLETAALMVMAAHHTPAEALASITASARTVMGLDPVEVVPGSSADLVAIRADSVRDAIASAPAERMVFRAGRLVAATTTDRWIEQ